MKHHLSLALFFLAALAAHAQTSWRVEQFGGELAGRNVFGIVAAHGNLYAAADTGGIYFHNPLWGSPAPGPFTWINLGLKGKHCREIAVHPTNPLIILVALARPAGTSGPIEVLYRSEDGGLTWTEVPNFVSGDQKTAFVVRRLRFDHADPSQVVAVGTYGVYRSRDAGKTWAPIEALQGYTINDVVWDDEHPGTMLAGGETLIMSAVLLKSTDDGATWTNKLGLSLGGDNAVDAIAIDPANPAAMIAGTEGYILRSTNYGDDWVSVLHPDRYYLYGAAFDSSTVGLAFITGGNVPPNTGGIFVSHDGGINWTEAAKNGWRTVQRCTTARWNPGALYFSAGYFADEGDTSLPGGVFIMYQETSSVRPEPSPSPGIWYSRGMIHLPGVGDEATWEVVDMLGRRVASGRASREASIVDVDYLETGVYILRIGSSTVKFAHGMR